MKAARKFNKNLTTDDMVTVNVLGSDYFYPSDDAQNYVYCHTYLNAISHAILRLLSSMKNIKCL